MIERTNEQRLFDSEAISVYIREKEVFNRFTFERAISSRVNGYIQVRAKGRRNSISLPFLIHLHAARGFALKDQMQYVHICMYACMHARVSWINVVQI